jgi:hypothetical protein
MQVKRKESPRERFSSSFCTHMQRDKFLKKHVEKYAKVAPQ